MAKFIQYFTKLNYTMYEFDILAPSFPAQLQQIPMYFCKLLPGAASSPVCRHNPAIITTIYLVTPAHYTAATLRTHFFYKFHHILFFPINPALHKISSLTAKSCLKKAKGLKFFPFYKKAIPQLSEINVYTHIEDG